MHYRIRDRSTRSNQIIIEQQHTVLEHILTCSIIAVSDNERLLGCMKCGGGIEIAQSKGPTHGRYVELPPPLPDATADT